MIPGFVEVSQESRALAEAEVVSAAETVGGEGHPGDPWNAGLVSVAVPQSSDWALLASRVALGRRCLVLVRGGEEPISAAKREGAVGRSARFRQLGRPSGGDVDVGPRECGRAYKEGGGRIDLETPQRRFWLVRGSDGREALLEETAEVDRTAAARRRMPLLPFQRPVSLPPKLARVAVNLARVRTGDRVVDPFLGTGALLAEAGLMGARLYGIDRDPGMVRGAIRNLAHYGLEAEELGVGDARSVEFEDRDLRFSAVVTDPPYGRSSTTGGSDAAELVAEAMTRWWDRLEPGGRLSLVVPQGREPPSFGVVPRFRLPVRVHRSLTREFLLFERTGASGTPR